MSKTSILICSIGFALYLQSRGISEVISLLFAIVAGGIFWIGVDAVKGHGKS